MFKDQSDFFKYFFMMADFLIAFLSGVAAFVLRFYILDPSGRDVAAIEPVSYLFFALLAAFLQIVAFSFIDLYHPRRIVKLTEEIFSIVIGVTLNLLVSLSIIFFLHVPDISRALVAYFAGFSIVFTAIAHAIVRGVLRNMRRRGFNLRTVIILGTEQSAKKVLRFIERNPMYGYRFIGFILERVDGNSELLADTLGSIDDLETILDIKRPNVLIMALEEASYKTAEKVLQLCDTYGTDLKIVPAYASLITAKGRVETMDGLPVISIREVPAREGLNRIFKRSFDICFSFLFIVLGSPVYLAVALLIKLSSKGPVFFKQERVGLDGRSFFMLKFRSMRVQAAQASDTVWTTKDDPRVTAIGRFIRKTSLDEIPQFFNVFAGQMSVVGPRPERPFYVEQFKHQYHHYMRRHAVKAGLTGWAQINGLRGDTSIQERIEADIYYIENWSFLFDLQIVLLTPFKGLVARNAY